MTIYNIYNNRIYLIIHEYSLKILKEKFKTETIFIVIARRNKNKDSDYVSWKLQ